MAKLSTNSRKFYLRGQYFITTIPRKYANRYLQVREDDLLQSRSTTADQLFRRQICTEFFDETAQTWHCFIFVGFEFGAHGVLKHWEVEGQSPLDKHLRDLLHSRTRGQDWEEDLEREVRRSGTPFPSAPRVNLLIGDDDDWDDF